jgi:capsular exopolysaccharide synthesis family protein
MEEINIKEFLQYLKKYTLIIIGIVIFLLVTISFYDLTIKTPMYTTSTTLVLVKDDSNSTKYEYNADGDRITQNDITLNQKLVATYRYIVKSEKVLDQVINKLNLTYSYDSLKKKIVVQAIEDTEILKISVTDSNAQTASDIANCIAEIFEKEVMTIYNINNVSVIDTAKIDNTPSNNTFFRDIVLAVFVGIVGSTAVIFVVYYFDDRLRYSDTLEAEIGMPIVGKVLRDNNKIELIVEKKPKEVSSESIRTLRTNLQFAAVDEELKTLLVTSTLPSEGKSFISANLAVSFAQAGKKVLLIDCDLRKGRQSKIFGVSSRRGLSNLLIHDVKEYDDYIFQSKVDNLFVMPRGIIPPNPSELLSSKKINVLFYMLKQHFDIIILDGAPALGLSDSVILSSIVDQVLLVTSANDTPKSELKDVKKTLENVGAHIAGIVVNNVRTRKHSYSNYYYYNYGYGAKDKK